jgi:cAMP phosphodiesterase
MKLRLLPSTIDGAGLVSERQHFACFVIDGCVAFDAGSLASSVSEEERKNIRDVVLTHAHLDHIAGLPLFIDDLFQTLTEPVIVHAERSVIDALEEHIFNWTIYPRFSEITNRFGSVVEYHEFEQGKQFDVRHLTVRAIAVNHKVPSSGFVINDASATIAITGDTAEMDEFWNEVNRVEKLSGLFIECALPNELQELASVSHHLTAEKLAHELTKFKRDDTPIYVINIKPAYREAVVSQIESLGIKRIEILEAGRTYAF